MKELRRKTRFTILAILSGILVTVIVFANVQNYTREKNSVVRALNIFDDRVGFRGAEDGMQIRIRPEGDVPFSGGDQPEGQLPQKPSEDSGLDDGFQPPADDTIPEQSFNPENMMVMDYELYTARIEKGEITAFYNHGNASEEFDAEGIAKEIIASVSCDARHVGNLYFENYSYNYRYPDLIVIMNNKDTSSKLWEELIYSLLLFVVLEALIIIISHFITNWITKPASDAFERQKEFIADASHELKTPLAVIMASADSMEPSGDDDKNLENIRYEADRMNRLIAGLLKLSKLENESDISAFKEENLSLILEKTCLAYEGVAFEQGVSIDTDIEENLRYKCNKEEIEQMAATLLDNAVKHSYKDSSVKMTAGKKGSGGLVIRVINKGDPIPEEDRERIFERFYRGDKSRSRGDNRYGLGLAIARRIARNHGGDITCISENGETVFKVILK